MVNLDHEEKSLKKTIDDENKEIDKLADVIEIVEKLMDHSHGLSLGQFAQIFRDIQVRVTTLVSNKRCLKYNCQFCATTKRLSVRYFMLDMQEEAKF